MKNACQNINPLVFRKNCKLQFVLDQNGTIMYKLYLHKKRLTAIAKKMIYFKHVI